MNDYQKKLEAIKSKRLSLEQRLVSGLSFIALWAVIFFTIATCIAYGPLIISMASELLGESWAVAAFIIICGGILLFIICSVWLMMLAFEQLVRMISGVAKDFENRRLH